MPACRTPLRRRLRPGSTPRRPRPRPPSPAAGSASTVTMAAFPQVTQMRRDPRGADRNPYASTRRWFKAEPLQHLLLRAARRTPTPLPAAALPPAAEDRAEQAADRIVEAAAGKRFFVVQAVSVGCISSFLVEPGEVNTFAGLFFLELQDIICP